MVCNAIVNLKKVSPKAKKFLEKSSCVRCNVQLY
nr:MAG TPA: hypothetical protein [Caudoviricetes sp.]